jgi:hypothetical protein
MLIATLLLSLKSILRVFPVYLSSSMQKESVRK